MRRIKIGTIILLYTIILTLVFAGMLLWTRYNAVNPQGTDPYAGAYLLTPQEIMQADTKGVLIEPDKVVDTGTLREQYVGSFLSGLTLPVIGLGLFLLLSSFLLWILLKSIEQKSTLRLARSLRHVTEPDAYLPDDAPVLKEAYAGLRERFDGRMQDFKRLNSYLSHEQKNALAILRTRLESDGRMEYLQNIDQITYSINDILTLSDNPDGEETSEVDVVMVCAQVCDLYRRVYLKISFSFDEEDDTVIAAKGRWIERAVSNLLDNAVKYGAGEPVEVAVRSRHHSVIVTVRDHGGGIPEEQQEEIFSHSYRVNELQKSGYGIGLSLVSHVCDLCGGFVTVESVPGAGSCFYLSFPIKKDADVTFK